MLKNMLLRHLLNILKRKIKDKIIVRKIIFYDLKILKHKFKIKLS
jgi:hypothetical protein